MIGVGFVGVSLAALSFSKKSFGGFFEANCGEVVPDFKVYPTQEWLVDKEKGLLFLRLSNIWAVEDYNKLEWRPFREGNSLHLLFCSS